MPFQLIIFILLLSSCQKHQTLPYQGAVEIEHPQNKTSKPNHSSLTSQSLLLDNPKEDGAPEKASVKSFKQAKPTDEPLSRYGNPAAYQVNDQHYEVKSSAKGYCERGLASWYGTKFHKKRTSSGEPYDLYAMTAAHKTLPLPTYMAVKNLLNSKEIIVKVNDRGPFHDDRIIDLSFAAASELDMLPAGTAPVEIRALSTHGTNKKAGYYIQAGAFSSNEFAEQLKSKLITMTKEPVFIESHKELYIVKLGPFTNKASVEQAKNSLAMHGIQDIFTVLQ